VLQAAAVTVSQSVTDTQIHHTPRMDTMHRSLIIAARSSSTDILTF